jgi:hypothetical protein
MCRADSLVSRCRKTAQPRSPSMPKLTTRRLLRRHAVPFIVSLLSLTRSCSPITR